MVFVELIEVQISEVVVGNLLGRHVVDGYEDLVGDGCIRAELSAASATDCASAVWLPTSLRR